MLDASRLNLFARLLRWKSAVDSRLLGLEHGQSEARRHLGDHEARLEQIKRHLEMLEDAVRDVWFHLQKSESWAAKYFSRASRQYFVRRGKSVRLLSVAGAALPIELQTSLADDVVDGVRAGSIDCIEGATLGEDGALTPWESLPRLLDIVQTEPALSRAALRSAERAQLQPNGNHAGTANDYYRVTTGLIQKNADLLDFLAQSPARDRFPAVPFDRTDTLPDFAVPKGKRDRSIIFLHNCYYHFNHLAVALRRRGWDAVTVSLEPPDSPQRQFMHGEDINLFDPNPERMRAQVQAFFRSVPERFGALQFYGKGSASFFPENFEAGMRNERVPWDFLELRRQGLIIGYSPSGCLDGALQSTIRDVTGGLCARCVWEQQPSVCSDAVNAAWIEKLNAVVDWIALETDWVTPERAAMNSVRGPVAMALDPQIWRPGLEIPPEARIERGPGELLVYHAVGNYKVRRAADRDIKGTGAVLAAIERLQAEGVPVRLFFATDIPSHDIRFYQAQADIVIDQLNYGRLGANARESLMLGRPLITNISRGQPPASTYMAELPAVHATEETIYDVLKALLNAPEQRRALSEAGRKFALKWHSADACAERFERVIDRVRHGLAAEFEQ